MAIDFSPAKKGEEKSSDIQLPSFLSELTQQKLDVTDRIFFTEQLALMLEAGMPLFDSLKAFSKLELKPALKKIIVSLMTNVEEGKSFSVALQLHAGFFTTSYINLIAAAENGGFLENVLSELQQMDEKREKLKSTVVSAMIYPAFLILFSFAVVIFVLVVVFPKFAVLFERIKDDLPGTTLVLMTASNALINYWWGFLLGLLLISVVAYLWLRSRQGIEIMDKLKLSIYLIKDIFIQLYIIQSMRLMSMSLANGVSAVDTLAACSDVVNNSVFNRFLAKIKIKVEGGEGFASGFEQATFIPPTVKQMIKTGDSTGNLSKVMARIADYYERELEKKLAVFTRLIEPIMLLVMGVVVGLLVSSLMLPIFKLSRAVG